MDMMRKRFVLTAGTALLWLTVAVAPVVPQNSETDSFVESIDVELVNVDVWVTGPKGDPVTGLEAADFEILHDDEKVPITHFTEARGGAQRRVPAAQGETEDTSGPEFGRGEPTAFFPSHAIVYVDQSRIHPRSYPGLVRSLEDFLTTEGVEPERVLVLRQVGGLFVEAPFGSSQKELQAALARLPQGAPSGLNLEAETDQALQAIRNSWEQSQDSLSSAMSTSSGIPESTGGPGSGSGLSSGALGGGFGVGPDACGSFAGQIQPIVDSFSRSRGQRVAITLANLTDAVSFVAGLSGVKALLYFGDSLDIQPGAALTSYAGSLCPAAGAELASNALSDRMTTPFLKLTRHANSNRVTIYSLQASGLSVPGVGRAKSQRNVRGGGARSRSRFESSQRIAEREGLSLMASETGGRAIFNQNELGNELAGIGRDLGTYYSLAYAPPQGKDRGTKDRSTGKGRRQHRIKVELRDRSWTARYRRGYLEKDATEWLTERIEGALNLGITSNPLEVRLGAGEIRPSGEGTFFLPLHVMAPVERLAFLPQGGSPFAEITLRTMSRNLASGAVTLHDKTLRVKGSPEAEGFADLVIELELDEGTHLMALGVRDEATGEASFISTTLEVSASQ
jgi:VWFA-related protein